MASGEVVGIIHQITYPGANPATPDVRVGGSTPAESYPVYDFDPATDEFIDLLVSLEGYDGGGLTVKLRWISAQTSNAVVWQVAIQAIPDDTRDVDTSHTYVFNTVTATSATVIGEVDYADVTFTNGADMDSLADGELAIVRVGRDANVGGDTMTGDAELLAVIITET